MTGETGVDRESEPEPESVTRRRFLRGTAAAGAVLGAPGFAAAQDESEVTTNVAVQNTAPKFDHPDYLGLFVQITGYDREVETTGVGSCGFLDADAEVAGFDAHIIDRISDDNRSAEATVFAADGNDTVSPGKLFVVNDQTQCEGGYVALSLEEIGASSIDVRTTEGNGGTGEPIPGFGIGAGLVGLGAAALGLARRTDGSG